ncbi:helix-turn-helix domain-containing protein [Paenibacillus hemerocallicola]|uniref:Helix-turn-helix domain-containing protein n=1 Tax=Paenibacillus hemerocallicola TaxID=1172614 RepID=A0A5C4TAZ0_9BACL|nr:AraC family transcriptional regulator [Paenibacillus hemerocallicola]TNJ66052.1 helix-turn-helix domain-containing protein [Paenibacillus hemerocallicola]
MTISPHKENTRIPDKTFPINIFFVGDVYLHWHDHIEWIYIQEGKAKVQMDADFVTLEQGELAFVNSKQVHGATSLASQSKLVCIVFNEALVRGSGMDITEYHYFQPYLIQRQKWPSTIRANEPEMQEIASAFARLIAEFEEKRPGYELIVKAELLRIFGLYFRYAQQSSAIRLARHPLHAYEFSDLLQFLREHYYETITIAQAAQMVSLSPNYFCRVFKLVTGKTLIEYIHLLRVQEAERLLLETDLPVTEIATAVGFTNMTYFGRIFKKIRNATPSKIRGK